MILAKRNAKKAIILPSNHATIPFTKNLQLGLSACAVIAVGLVYGLYPAKIIPVVLGFEVEALELKNIFRAMMGLYMAVGVYWIIGIVHTDHWRSATLSNVIFMGGLAFGRLVSTIFDGVSLPYTVGLLLELIFMAWGIYNLKRISNQIDTP